MALIFFFRDICALRDNPKYFHRTQLQMIITMTLSGIYKSFFSERKNLKKLLKINLDHPCRTRIQREEKLDCLIFYCYTVI